jgi:hypothetical protein
MSKHIAVPEEYTRSVKQIDCPLLVTRPPRLLEKVSRKKTTGLDKLGLGLSLELLWLSNPGTQVLIGRNKMVVFFDHSTEQLHSCLCSKKDMSKMWIRL